MDPEHPPTCPRCTTTLLPGRGSCACDWYYLHPATDCYLLMLQDRAYCYRAGVWAEIEQRQRRGSAQEAIDRSGYFY